MFTALRELVAGRLIGASLTNLETRELRLYLQYFIPEVLAASYVDWQWESLDRFEALSARLTADGEVGLLGLAVLMTDQTLVLFHVRLGVGEGGEVGAFDIRLGEASAAGMVRTGIADHGRLWNRVYLMEGKPAGIQWMFEARR